VDTQRLYQSVDSISMPLNSYLYAVYRVAGITAKTQPGGLPVDEWPHADTLDSAPQYNTFLNR
jgi:hypothetical protein